MARTPAAIVIDQDVQSRFEMKQVVRASGLTFAGEAGFGQEAITLASDSHPDIAIVALNEPMERPLQTIESLLALFPETPVIVYSQAKDVDAWRNAMRAGVRDLLPVPVRPEMLRDAVIKAMASEETRRLRSQGEAVAPPSLGTVVTVFGAKGGIGKSTLAVNLAVALASDDTSTVIVDLDTGFGDVTAMLNLRTERTLADLVRSLDNLDREELRQFLTRHEATGLDVLASPPVLEWRNISPEDLRRVIEILARYYDKIVLDTSGSLTDISEVALDMATMILWVTTSEFTSVRDSLEAIRALEALSIPKERVRFILNASSADDRVQAKTIQEVLQKEVFWQVPYDRRVRQGTHFGQPIVVSAPQSAAARSFTELAHAIAGGRSGNGRKPTNGMKWLPGTSTAKVGG